MLYTFIEKKKNRRPRRRQIRFAFRILKVKSV